MLRRHIVRVDGVKNHAFLALSYIYCGFIMKCVASATWETLPLVLLRTRRKVVSFVVEAKEKSSRERCRKRHLRIRNRVQGTADRPRLAVFRSNNHIYCQVIDDVAQRTLAAANTMQAHVKEKVDFGGNVEAAMAVGTAVAEACKKVDVTKVVFDRGGNLYHGRIKALADAAREGGLEF